MTIGVIFAGGVGSRMGLVGRPKQFLEVNGKPVIVHTLEHFETCPDVDVVVVVCLADWIDHMKALKVKFGLGKIAAIVPGGATGQESIYEGLIAARRLCGEDDAIVLVHDGVRPLISAELLTENVQSVRKYGSAVTCARMVETAVRVEDEEIREAFPRPAVQVAKAPQSFWLKEILAAHEDARAQGKNDYIDSCSLMMHYKESLHFIGCGTENIKITHFEDVYLMQAILRAREDQVNYTLGGR